MSRPREPGRTPHQPPLIPVQPLPGTDTPVQPAFGQMLAHCDTGSLQGTVRRRQREFQVSTVCCAGRPSTSRRIRTARCRTSRC
jgi:hypothetical protein